MAPMTGESYYDNVATIGTGITFSYICATNAQEAKTAQAASA